MQIKAWRIHEYGDSAVLRLDVIDLPLPGPGEVRLKIAAAGLNRSDLLWIGAGFFRPDLPALVGAEVCGVVEAVGPEVEAFLPGDRVSNLPIFSHSAASAYSHFGEYAILPVEELVYTPAALSDDEGAAFMFTNLTQVCGLSDTADLKAGETALITAGSSANGLNAIALARKMGAHVIATSRTPDKRDLLIDAGAHDVVVTKSEQLAQRVSDITGGRGVDVAYDCVGGALSPEILASLAPQARWVMYGFLDTSPVTMAWPMWFARQCSLKIYSLVQFTGSREMNMPGRPAEFQHAVRTVLSLHTNKSLPIPIAQTFGGIEAVQEAFRAMESNQGGGKIVVRF